MDPNADTLAMGTNRSKQINLNRRDLRDSISKSQHGRQVIICLFQIAFAVNAAVILRYTRHGSWSAPASRGYFIPLVLYILFAIWCVVRSRDNRLRPFEVILSILMDFYICATVLYAFKLAPTTSHGAGAIRSTMEWQTEAFFSFIFPLITLRSLHFKPIYVIVAGIMAVLVWIGQLISGLHSASTIFSTAMRVSTFNLVVASADKLASIVVVTLVLVISGREAGRHLRNSTLRGAAGRGLARMVGAHVAKEVLFSNSIVPGRGRRETAAILMVDLQDFTRLAFQVNPSDVLTLLAHYQQLIEPVISRNGGFIDKFMGDGILAHFGAIESSSTYAAQALRCIEEILITMDKWNERRLASGKAPIYCRIACDVGRVVVGLVGGATKMELTIIGDPVNMTAKLEKHSKKLGARAITTARSFDTARLQGYVPLVPPASHPKCSIEGVRDSVDLIVIAAQKRYEKRTQHITKKSA